MQNPFEASGNVEHFPSNLTAAFEDIAADSRDTADLLASKSRFYSTSALSLSSKRTLKSELLKSTNSNEKSFSIADLANTDTFDISKSTKKSEAEELKESKYEKPPVSPGFTKDSKHHCKTCKCQDLKTSASTVTLAESSSLQYLSKLESIPFPVNTCKPQLKIPYTSPIYKLSASPSQIFRQRINSHILQFKLIKTYSQPIIHTKNQSNSIIY